MAERPWRCLYSVQNARKQLFQGPKAGCFGSALGWLKGIEDDLPV